MTDFQALDFAADDLSVQVCELLIATSDGTDPLIDSSVHQVLKLLREQHHLEAAFIAEVVDGRRVCLTEATNRQPRLIQEDADPLTAAYCRQALNVPVPFGCFLSAPVVLASGGVYGTLYAFNSSADEVTHLRDLKKLEMSAQLAARLIDSRAPRVESMPESLEAEAA